MSGETVTMHQQDTWRRRVAEAATILAALALVGAVVSWWSSSRPFDPDRFAAAVEVALEEPPVIDAVASTATDQLVDLVLAVSDPRQVLPGPLQDLGSPLEGLVRGFLSDQMARLVATEPVRRVLVSAVREAHAEVIVVLRDGRTDRGLLTIDDDVVLLDVTGVLAAGLDALVERRLLPGGLGGLQERLRGGVDSLQGFVAGTLGLGADGRWGTIVVYDASTVDQGGLALRSARWFSSGRLATWHLLGVALAASTVAVVMATSIGVDRRRLATLGGLALVAGSLGAHLYVWRVGVDVVDLLGDGAGGRLAHVVIGELRPSLSLSLAATAVVGLGVALGATGRVRPRPAQQR
jgi:hypothetical protein